MCGVAGAYQQADGKVIVNAMTDPLAHRGPDASGVVEIVDPSTAVFLAHRRLSIIDLSAAADQPFAKDGLTLSYNGEIYNYLDIRRDLEARGVRFRTNSDTEVLLEAWRQWGTGCLRRLRGMFAFAVYDETTGSLTLARDPLGIKPLYILRRGDGVVFASELKAIVAALGPELKVDPRGMVASTLYYWLPQQYDAVRGVRKLPPGSWTEYHRDGSSRSGTYWNPAEVAARAEAGPPAASTPAS
jgi:asparagine synthase (glutamine-hydrolysing)